MIPRHSILRSAFSRCSILGAAALLAMAAPAAHGAIIIQELFDDIAGPPPGTDAPLDGKGDNATSIGFTGTWTGNDDSGIYTASNFNSGNGVPGLPPTGGDLGGVWNHTNAYTTDIYAVRPLATPIDFSKEQTLYYSFVADNGGDVAMGVGFASGSDISSEFVGAGLTWNNARTLATQEIDASNAAAICYGFLDLDSGPYGIRAHEAMNSVNGPALVVVRLTIHSNAPDQIDIKRYAPGDTIESDPSLVTWSASDTYDTAMQATHLLLWINGVSGNLGGEIDGIRVGTTWADVVGAPVAADPYTAWATGSPYFLTGDNALPGADPDHDGIPNAIEFILGGNPTSSGDSALLPTGAVSGGNFVFTFRRTAASAAATPAPVVEYSGNLSSWVAAQNGVGGVTIVTTPNFYATGVDRVVVTLPQSLAGGQKIFARLNSMR